jgi:hypothetical protein
MNTINELLAKTGQSETTILREHLIMVGMSKLSKYEAECALFEKKYNGPVSSLRTQLDKEGQENYEMEDDLLDWEFADASIKWWKTRLEELKRAA